MTQNCLLAAVFGVGLDFMIGTMVLFLFLYGGDMKGIVWNAIKSNTLVMRERKRGGLRSAKIAANVLRIADVANLEAQMFNLK